MKWRRKYNINIGELHRKHLAGYSLVDLSKQTGIPRTTINRYFDAVELPVYFNRHNLRLFIRKRAEAYHEYKCVTAWKRALIRKYGHICQVCGYDFILEAHHIVPQVDGGKSTVENGALVCPNHHAEAHAGIIDLKALLKRGELLGRPAEDNQQPSRISSGNMRDTEGSETREVSKGTSPRALRAIGIPEYLVSNREDIVRTADIPK